MSRCGRQFDTRRGLGVHHSHVHDARLPNRACANCGTAFYSDYEKRYRSEECYRSSVSYEGPANPNYSGGTEPTECELCETAFEYCPSEKEGLYCPDCVENEPWQKPPGVSGSDHLRWAGGTQVFECTVCGDVVEREPRNVTSDVVHCSRDCHSDWLSETVTGEGHPNWEGGDVGPYGPGWNAVRRRALERDGYECVVCGTGRDEIGRNPDVHHLLPVRAFVRSDDHGPADAHFLANVASLCVGCHRKADAGSLSRERLRRAIQ